MRRIWTAPLIFGLSALMAGAGIGCNTNPVILIEYLLSDGDPKTEAEYPLKPRPKHEKEEVKVVVLTSCGGAYNADMIGVDRLLASEFIPMLEARCKDNKELVSVLKSQPIDAYKRENPDWRALDPVEIGKKFGADYVIDIEVIDMSIFEPKSNLQIMRGRATVDLKAYNLSKAFKDPDFKPSDYAFEYPKTHEVDRSEMKPSTFRQNFIKKMASDLVSHFTANTANQIVNVD